MIPNLSTFKSAPVGTAWKAAAMRGYVKKLAPTAGVSSGTTYDAGVFDLVFVQADGDQYVYRYFPTPESMTGHAEVGSALGPFVYVGLYAKDGNPQSTTTLADAPAGYASTDLGTVFSPANATTNISIAFDRDLLGWVVGMDAWTAGRPEDFEAARTANARDRIW